MIQISYTKKINMSTNIFMLFVNILWKKYILL